MVIHNGSQCKNNFKSCLVAKPFYGSAESKAIKNLHARYLIYGTLCKVYDYIYIYLYKYAQLPTACR
jgi:hypothetical protein